MELLQGFKMLASLKRGTPIQVNDVCYIVGSELDENPHSDQIIVLFANEHTRGETFLNKNTIVKVLA